MRLGTKDREGVIAFQQFCKTEGGKKALEFIDRLLLAGECAYLPGNRHGQTEFRCGIQKAGMMLHEYSEKKIDWMKIEEKEKEFERMKEIGGRDGLYD